MPTQPVSGVPLSGTFGQELSLPPGPLTPATSVRPWSGDQSWMTTYNVGEVPAAPLWQSTSAPAADSEVAGTGGGGGFGHGVFGTIGAVVGSIGSFVGSTLAGWFGGHATPDAGLQRDQARAVASARRELALGVREHGSENHGARVEMYARTCGMKPAAWCGFFVGYNYRQAGFAEPAMMASTANARNFFLYLTSDKSAEHRAQGSTRQFFMLPESPVQSFVRDNASRLHGYSAQANTFNWWTLPIRTGDAVIFDRDTSNGAAPTHIGLVESYDPRTGVLTTIEGNTSDRVSRRTYDLKDADVRRTISGFGRPAAGDFS